MLSLLAAVSISRSSTGVSLTVDETVAIVASSIIVAAATWTVRKNHELIARNKAMTADVHDIKIALIGEQASPLNPSPSSGLIKVVAEHSQMLQELIADKKKNGGKTTRDAIDRIEKSVGSAPPAPGESRTQEGK